MPSTPLGPCMCGATDCPSCGPAQGYTRTRDLDITERTHALAADLATVSDALASFTEADFASEDQLVFNLLNSPTVDGPSQAEFARLGEHIFTCVVRILHERATKECAE